MNMITDKVDVKLAENISALTDKTIVENSLIVKRKPVTFYEGDSNEIPTLNELVQETSSPTTVEEKEEVVDSKELQEEKNNEEETEIKQSDASEVALKSFAEQIGGADVNDKGELIDKEGNILKTTEETEAALKEYQNQNTENQNTEESSFISNYQKLMGYEIKDTQGNPIEYPDTEEGLVEYNKAIVALQVNEARNKFLDGIPGIREYASFMSQGGSPKEYFERYIAPQTNWSEMEVKKGIENDNTNYNIVKSAFMARGMSEERAIQQADLVKEAGKLYETATIDQKDMAELEQLNRNKVEEESRLKAEQQEIENRKYWNTVQSTVQSGKVGGIQIPEADKDGFYNYLAVAKDQYGRSQAMIDAESSSVEDTLMLEFLRFKKLNLNSLIQATAGTQRVKSIRDRIKAGVGVGTGGQHSPHIQQVDSSGEGVTLENIIPK